MTGFRRSVVVGATFAALGVAAVPAQAALTGPGGAVRLCVARSGAVTIAAFTAKCPKGRRTLIIGAQGAGGPSGAQGPQGAGGPQGAPGTPADPSAVTGLQARVATLEDQVHALQTVPIPGSRLAPNAITTDKVLDNTLTGADINEATLGTVPSATDAATVGGLGPSQLIQGGGRVLQFDATVNGSDFGTVLSVPGVVTVSGFCGATTADIGQYGFQTGTEGFLIYTDNGGGNPTTLSVGPNTSSGSSTWAVDPAGDHVTFELEGSPHQVWIDGWSQARRNLFTHTTFCSFTGHAVVTP